MEPRGFGYSVQMDCGDDNDVICAKGWLRNLLAAAEANQLHVASPAMVEGELNYDFGAWATEAEAKMAGYVREGAPHAMCMAICDDVWNEIGYFMPVQAVGL